MNSFVYVVTEGVHDVTFLGKLLGREHGAKQIVTDDGLDDVHQKWLKVTGKWPGTTLVKGVQRFQIDRFAVPAPAFYRLPDERTVALRNAEGIDKITSIIEGDMVFFEREGTPDVIGIVLDSDEKDPAVRLQSLNESLREKKVNLSIPPSWGEISTGSPRVGVFSLPEPGVAGTLEDLLLALGKVAYPELLASADDYAQRWQSHLQSTGTIAHGDWKGLRKPAGVKKATITAMTAMLKPGKAMHMSLQDHGWISATTKDVPALTACITFLRDLLA